MACGTLFGSIGSSTTVAALFTRIAVLPQPRPMKRMYWPRIGFVQEAVYVALGPAGAHTKSFLRTPPSVAIASSHALSTKVLEYAAMAKPVVASRLPTVERYFSPDTLSVYEPGDPESLASVILGLVDDAPGRRARIDRTRKRIDELSWARQAEAYKGVVNRLTARPRSAKTRRIPPP